LISSGYKTYLLTVFYKEFAVYDGHPSEMQAMVEYLATQARRGLSLKRRYPFSKWFTPLRKGIAEVSMNVARPACGIYVSQNPGHVKGDEWSAYPNPSR
jgi:hypothetical protein